MPDAARGPALVSCVIAAYNSAEEQYGEESRAHRVAWSAVENKYENEGDNRVENDRYPSKRRGSPPASSAAASR